MASPLQVNKQIAAECASCASPKTGCSDVSLRNGVEISDYSSFRLPSPSSAPTIFQLFTFAVEETSCLRVRGLMTGAKNETKNHAVSKKKMLRRSENCASSALFPIFGMRGDVARGEKNWKPESQKSITTRP